MSLLEEGDQEEGGGGRGVGRHVLVHCLASSRSRRSKAKELSCTSNWLLGAELVRLAGSGSSGPGGACLGHMTRAWPGTWSSKTWSLAGSRRSVPMRVEIDLQESFELATQMWRSLLSGQKQLIPKTKQIPNLLPTAKPKHQGTLGTWHRRRYFLQTRLTPSVSWHRKRARLVGSTDPQIRRCLRPVL